LALSFRQPVRGVPAYERLFVIPGSLEKFSRPDVGSLVACLLRAFVQAFGAFVDLGFKADYVHFTPSSFLRAA
jgi:hypothetical protein